MSRAEVEWPTAAGESPETDGSDRNAPDTHIIGSSASLAADAADPEKPDPAVVTRALEGDWVLLPHKATLGAKTHMVTWIDEAGFGHFKPLGAERLADLSYLRVEAGKLRLLNQLDKPGGLPVLIGGATGSEPGICRITVTLPDGKAATGVCRVVGDKLEVRFPETCVCAKSGDIAVYQRWRNRCPSLAACRSRLVLAIRVAGFSPACRALRAPIQSTGMRFAWHL